MSILYTLIFLYNLFYKVDLDMSRLISTVMVSP